MTREERFKMDMINEFKLMCEIVGNNGRIIVNKHRMLKALKQEPRKGKWYRQTNDYVDYYECSECGMAIGIYDVKNYCPNCGSRNEVEE